MIEQRYQKRVLKSCAACGKKYSAAFGKRSEFEGFCSRKCHDEFWMKRESYVEPVAARKLRKGKSQPSVGKKQKKQRRRERKLQRQQRNRELRAHREDYARKSKEFFESRAWRNLRYEAFQKHGRQCQCCGAKPPNVVLHVDHVKPRFHYPELALDINNLQVLCEACNVGKGARYEDDFRTV